MTKPLPKIAKCKCRRLAEVCYREPSYYVICGSVSCWVGPVRRTERKAIAAWNALMGRKGKTDA